MSHSQATRSHDCNKPFRMSINVEYNYCSSCLKNIKKKESYSSRSGAAEYTSHCYCCHRFAPNVAYVSSGNKQTNSTEMKRRAMLNTVTPYSCLDCVKSEWRLFYKESTRLYITWVLTRNSNRKRNRSAFDLAPYDFKSEFSVLSGWPLKWTTTT